MSDKDSDYCKLRKILFVTVVVLVFNNVCADLGDFPLRASKVEFPSDRLAFRFTVISGRYYGRVLGPDCLDSDGQTRAHMEEWVSYPGACDLRICYVGNLLKHKVMYDCPAVYNPDPDNCQSVSDSSLPFPQCCPEMQCATGSINDVTNPACYDKSPTWACEIWKELSDCMDSPDPPIQNAYNMTIDHCQLTCGYC